jgi:hypothetical protein
VAGPAGKPRTRLLDPPLDLAANVSMLLIGTSQSEDSSGHVYQFVRQNRLYGISADAADKTPFVVETAVT